MLARRRRRPRADRPFRWARGLQRASCRRRGGDGEKAIRRETARLMARPVSRLCRFMTPDRCQRLETMVAVPILFPLLLRVLRAVRDEVVGVGSGPTACSNKDVVVLATATDPSASDHSHCIKQRQDS